MTRLACAEWRPLSTNYTHGGVTRPPRGLVVHTEVTPATLTANDACWRYMNNPAVQVSSYWLVGIDGHIIQAVDLDDRAWTQMAGNDDWCAAENAGDGTKEGLTDAQIVSNATILAELHQLYGVPLQLAHSPSDRGLGYHAMGGAAWGGHPCPGALVIAQLPLILEHAIELAGGPTPTPGGNSMSRMVAHSEGGVITLNDADGHGNGDRLIAMHPAWKPQAGKAEPTVFHLAHAASEIIATADGHGIICRYADGSFPVVTVDLGTVS